MASLFGPTPQEIIYARMKEDEKMRMLRDQQISQEGSQFGVFAPLYQAGRRFGEMGSKAIVSGLFPEAVSPDLRRAQATQMILDKYQGQDLSDPAVLKSIGSEFMTAGVPEAGIKAITLAKELGPKRERINVAAGGTVIDESGNVIFQAPDKDTRAKVDKDFATAAGSLGLPVKGFIDEYTADEIKRIDAKLAADKKVGQGTEFERLIAGLPPEEQIRLKKDYLAKITSKTLGPAELTLAQKESGQLDQLRFGATDVAEAISNLKSGKLKLSLSDNFANTIKTLTSKGDEGSIAYNKFQTALETLRNARLNLNVGVQTEGDALRAANEFLAGYAKYDTKTALSQLERVFKKLEQAYNSKGKSLTTLYGGKLPEGFVQPFPTIGGTTQTTPAAPNFSEDQLRSGFERAKAQYPEWATLGYEAYKKQILGQ